MAKLKDLEKFLLAHIASQSWMQMDVKIQLQQIFPSMKVFIFSLHLHVPGGSDGMAYMSSTGCSCNSSNCQFIWTNEEGEIIAQGDGSTAEETYKYLFDIPAGVYTATIIHPNGCVLEEETIVPETDLIGEAIIEHICPGSGLLGSLMILSNKSPNLISPYCVWENYPVFDGLTLANDLNPAIYTCQWDTDGNGIIEPIFDCFQTKSFTGFRTRARL